MWEGVNPAPTPKPQSSLIVNLFPKAALDPPSLSPQCSICRERGCKSAVLRASMHLPGLLPRRAVGRKFRGGLPSPLVGTDREGQVDPRLFTCGVLVISSTAPRSSTVSHYRPGTPLGILQADGPGPLQVCSRLMTQGAYADTLSLALWCVEGGGEKKHMLRSDQHTATLGTFSFLCLAASSADRRGL